MKYDRKKVHRKVVGRALESDVFILGQALGGRTQRLSGLPYISVKGQLSSTGKNLDNFLSFFGYTLNPSSSLKYAYSSDMVQCYPGRMAKGDRKPTQKEMENCSEWLDIDLNIIKPIVVILLGKETAKQFLKKYLGVNISKVKYFWGRKYQFEGEGKSITVFAVPHPAYRWRNRQGVDQIYRKTALQLRKILHKTPYSRSIEHNYLL